MFQVVIASNNGHKIREIGEILAGMDVGVCGYREVFPDVIDVEEDGVTFEENAVKKVMAYPARADVIYLGDDSGLEVAALGGAPGIYSARFAGPGASREMLCQKLLSELDGVDDRRAQFRCTIALRFPGDQIRIAEGIVRGQIIDELRGEQGFGYDPVFVPDGFDLTFAQMSAAQKNGLSHRGRALLKARGMIDAFFKFSN